jgi:hypothetical protein
LPLLKIQLKKGVFRLAETLKEIFK